MADHQIYMGDVFELADQATRFVMSHISNWVGTRETGDTAEVPTKFELPYDAVKEAIVNAIVHRDYTSNASVQVMLFKDRLEVWSPGSLPHGMTIGKLSKTHKSVPVNPLLARAMYLKGYIEKSGTQAIEDTQVGAGKSALGAGDVPEGLYRKIRDWHRGHDCKMQGMGHPRPRMDRGRRGRLSRYPETSCL